jgi:sugar lactone lactonase YvrE
VNTLASRIRNTSTENLLDACSHRIHHNGKWTNKPMKKLHLVFLSFVLIGTLIPHAVRAAAGDLFVADAGTDSVVKYNPAGNTTTFAPGVNGAGGVAFDSKGNVYVSDAATNAVLKFTPGGVKSVFASGFSGGPLGLAFDPAGNLVVSSSTGNLTKVNPAGIKTPFASGLNQPAGLAFNKGGTLYVADNDSGNVFQFTPGGLKSVFASGFSAVDGPFGLAFDSAGNLFVSDNAAGTITKIAPNGTKTPFASGIAAPRGLAFDSSGNLLVAANGSPSALLLFTPAGTRTTFAGGSGAGVGSPSLIAFEPVLHNLLNLSNRGFVQTGDSVLFAGFIVGGNGEANATIVVRGIGPSLTAFGVPNVLGNPIIEVRDGTGAFITQNDDWKGPQQAQIQATGLAPTNDKESAVLVTLPAGQYTAIVRGVGNSTGNAVVEVFNLQ